MKTVFLLGADDPEMEAIEKVLMKKRFHVEHAQIQGKRVHPGNAYWADPVRDLSDGCMLVCVECRPTLIPKGVELKVIDHHRAGDPGYDLGPERFWEAASIGQIYNLLNIHPTEGAMILAAMDHCFSASLRDECPGVFGLDVLLVSVDEVSKRTKTGQGRVLQQIRNMSGLLGKAPVVRIGNQNVMDLRSRHLGEGYSLDLIAAQIAAAMRKHAALLRHRSVGGEKDKYSLTGHIQSVTVETFMSDWAPKEGLIHIYGVPSRGYAGGRLP